MDPIIIEEITILLAGEGIARSKIGLISRELAALQPAIIEASTKHGADLREATRVAGLVIDRAAWSGRRCDDEHLIEATGEDEDAASVRAAIEAVTVGEIVVWSEERERFIVSPEHMRAVEATYE
jgi:hypothetical protein